MAIFLTDYWLPTEDSLKQDTHADKGKKLKIYGELVYTWKKFRLGPRLGSNMTFFTGSVNQNIFPGSNLKISY